MEFQDGGLHVQSGIVFPLWQLGVREVLVRPGLRAPQPDVARQGLLGDPQEPAGDEGPDQEVQAEGPVHRVQLLDGRRAGDSSKLRNEEHAGKARLCMLLAPLRKCQLLHAIQLVLHFPNLLVLQKDFDLCRVLQRDHGHARSVTLPAGHAPRSGGAHELLRKVSVEVVKRPAGVLGELEREAALHHDATKRVGLTDEQPLAPQVELHSAGMVAAAGHVGCVRALGRAELHVAHLAWAELREGDAAASSSHPGRLGELQLRVRAVCDVDQQRPLLPRVGHPSAQGAPRDLRRALEDVHRGRGGRPLASAPPGPRGRRSWPGQPP
mmetsp:Transcript_32997/g.103340  ORF Transcript_32997/g.103340 Transcript_32997/m.103340 type:complete len:324 (-) Transcript_32997:13-984(-)